jgi:hypothetical protein
MAIGGLTTPGIDERITTFPLVFDLNPTFYDVLGQLQPRNHLEIMANQIHGNFTEGPPSPKPALLTTTSNSQFAALATS